MTDAIRILGAYITVIILLLGGFYSLVIYPFVLDDLVKGAIIGFMGAAVTWVFGAATASSTARQQQDATAEGAKAGAMMPNAQPPTEVDLPFS